MGINTNYSLIFNLDLEMVALINNISQTEVYMIYIMHIFTHRQIAYIVLKSGD